MSGKRKLFRELVLIMALMMGVFAVGMISYIQRNVLREKMNKIDHSQLRVLQQVSDALDGRAGTLREQSVMFLNESSFIQYAISSLGDSHLEERDISESIRKFSAISTNASNTWVWFPRTGKVLGTDGAKNVSDSPAAPIIEQYLSEEHARQYPDCSLSFTGYDRHFFLLVDFRPSKSIALFVYQMPVDFLPAPENLKLTMTDDQGRILLLEGQIPEINAADAGTGAGISADSTDAGIFSEAGKDSRWFYTASTKTRQQERYCLAESSLLGLRFFSPLIPGDSLFRPDALLRLVLPSVFAILLVGAAATWFITRTVYRPINQLLDLVVNRTEERDAAARTASSMKLSVENIQADNAELSSHLSTVRDGTYGFIIRKILGGRFNESTDGSLLHLLPPGPYSVILMRPAGSAVLPDQAVDGSIRLQAVEQIAAGFPGCLCTMHYNEDTLLAVFRPEKQSAGEETAELERQIRDRAGMKILTGMGTPCSDISELRDSLATAAIRLRYVSYLEEDPDPETVAAFRARTAADLAEAAVKKALKEQSTAEELCGRLVLLAQDPKKPQALLNAGVHALTGELTQLGKEAPPAGFSVSEGSPAPGASPETEISSCLAWFREALPLAQEPAGRSSARYVEEAELYMNDHYMDSALGITEISDRLGISASYFSSIFNETKGESVISCLNRIRVQHAMELLSGTDLLIRDIGFRCGFSSSTVFSRVFSKTAGMSPSQFRARSQTGGDDTAQKKGKKVTS